MRKSPFLSILGLMFLFGPGYASVDHRNLTYSGIVDFVIVDDGTGVYAGTKVGDMVTGIFNYGVNSNNAVITPDGSVNGETGYKFSGSPFSSRNRSPTATTNTNDAKIIISNDNPIGVNSPSPILPQLSILAGFPINQRDPHDGWGTESQFGNLIYGLQIYSFKNLNWAIDQSYFPVPTNTGDLAIFFIFEVDTTGNLIYAAFGEVDNLAFTVVPSPVVPVAAWQMLF